MKTKTKKIIIGSSISLVAAAAAATGFGVYFSTPSIQSIASKGIYSIRQNAKLIETGYKYDVSASYGTPQPNSINLLVTNNLISIKNEGKLILNENGETVRPSYESYEFELADAVVVYLEDAKNPNQKVEIVFDSDAAEFPKTFSPHEINTCKISTDKHSINNEHIFKKLISLGALQIDNPQSIQNNTLDANNILESNIRQDGNYVIKHLGFSIKQGVKWVDSNGNKTKYDVVPEDFYYSFKRTKLFDTRYRESHGGSRDLDSYFIKKANATTRFLLHDQYPNEYLFDFFDLDSTALYSKNTAILDSTALGRKTFAFSIKQNVERTTGFAGVISKFVVNNIVLSAAPSQYIDELAAQAKLNENLNGLSITDEAREFGIYTYGQTRESTLFASQYIPTSAIEQREIFTYNKHYANQSRVSAIENGEKTVPKIVNGKLDYDNLETVYGIKKVIFEYSNGIDTSTYNSQLLTSYLNGTISEMNYSDLSPAQKQQIYGNSTNLTIQEIRNNAIKNGLQFDKKINISSLVQRTIVQSNPIPTAKNNYLFNDNYSKLVYGSSLDELSAGTANTANGFYLGDGMEFRTLVQASFNWDAYISQVYSGQRILWLNSAAQDAKFSSFDQNSGTPFDFYDTVNTLEFFDRKTNQFVTVTPQEMKMQSNNPIQEEQFKSPKYDLIKENMKLLLDDFYQRNNLNPSEKISWKVVYPYWDQDTTKTTIMEYVVMIINSLDPRINAQLVIPKTKEETISLITKNYGVSDFNGWGYDYEGIGSYFGAFINGTGVGIFNALSLFAQNDPANQRLVKMQEQLPEFTKMSKYVIAEADKEIKQFQLNPGVQWADIEPNSWYKLTNKQNQNLKDYFAEFVPGYDPVSSLSKIFKKYESVGVTDDQWAQLIKEMNIIKGVSTDSDNSIVDPKRSELTLKLSDYQVPTSKYGVVYFADYKYIKK